MENPTSRFYPSNIIAACIVAIGLITAACIVVQRPVALQSTVAMRTIPATYPAKTLDTPPLSQETVAEQVRTQILAVPDLQTYRYNDVVYKLTNVTVSQVSYSAKDDAFCAMTDWHWQPAMPPEGAKQSYITLSNNGYNQYLGTVFLNHQYANICVK